MRQVLQSASWVILEQEALRDQAVQMISGHLILRQPLTTMMISDRKNKTILSILGILAFAAAAYFLFFFQKGNLSSGREGLSRFSVETFKAPTGWGYRIYQDTTAVIEQRFIPGTPGARRFC
jgi:hypothetical protein